MVSINDEAWREDYRKKQAAGVKFEFDYGSNTWDPKFCSFTGRKEWYREVPQESETSTADKSAFTENKAPKPTVPHVKERALYWSQREAGTNEIWQCFNTCGPALSSWFDEDGEPAWRPDCKYRVKPMKLTARIVRRKELPFDPFKVQVQDWEFYGTREEYRAECESCGYIVVSEITQIAEKPKTVKYYFALMKNSAGEISVEWCDESNLSTLEKMGSGWSGHTIIGDIEEREISE